MNMESKNEQKLLMKDSKGNEITVVLVSEDTHGDPPSSKLVKATTEDGRSIAFDQMSMAWVIGETGEILSPINAKL